MFRLPQILKALEYTQERFLRHFLRIFPLTAHQKAVLKYFGAKMLDKFVKRAGMSRE